MGRILASVEIQNPAEPTKVVRCDALVDTGAAYMVLPMAWKDRLGVFSSSTQLEVETATQETVIAEVHGPARIQVEGFRPIFNEVMFVDMKPEDGVYCPLIGYLVLEQSQAAVDMLGASLAAGKTRRFEIIQGVLRR